MCCCSPSTWTVGTSAFPEEFRRDRDLLDDLLDFFDSAELLVVPSRGGWIPDGACRDDDDGRWSASGLASDEDAVVSVCCGEMACGVTASAAWSTRPIS